MHVNDFPYILKPIVEMKYPNGNVNFHSGNFKLTWENEEYSLKGELILKWLPGIQINFIGEFDKNSKEFNFKTFGSSISVEIECIETNFKAKGVLKKIHRNINKIECLLTSPINIGNIEEPVDFIQFEITNQEQRKGNLVRTDKNTASHNRMVLRDNAYEITIDEYVDSLRLRSELAQIGGFQFLCSGKINATNDSLSKLEELESTFEKFSQFLLFLNARKSSPLIFYGYKNEKVIWKHIRTSKCEQDNFYNGWVLKHEDLELSKIWDKFCIFWADKNDRESLAIILKWYNEANKRNIALESRIVLIQNALELLFNWLITEKFKYVSLNDSKKISASAKIAFLLSNFQLEHKIPIELNELIKYSKVFNFESGPETFTHVRNCIVHSNSKKISQLQKLSEAAKKEAVNMGIWYVEVILLKLFEYTGEYHNRCIGLKKYDAKDKI